MMSQNEITIQQIIDKWAAAVRERNMDDILSNHSADIIMFDVPEPFESRGIEAYRKTWDIFFKETEPGIFDIREMNIFADEHVAFSILVMNCSTKNAGGEFESLDFRVTIGLRKIDVGWTIVHEHHSIPATT